MNYALIPLIIATIVGGITTALQWHRANLWRARATSLEFQQRQHLQTIYALQRRLQPEQQPAPAAALLTISSPAQ